MKAMLIMDMPKCCADCPCLFEREGYQECEAIVNTIEEDIYKEKPTWCPLRFVPEYQNDWYEDFRSDWERGYNACIDEILGGAENG